MIESKTDGGPALPQPCQSEGHAAHSPYGIAGGGMSLRAYFAGQVLPVLVQAHIDQSMYGLSKTDIASECCSYVDHLIAELNKPESTP